MNDTQRRRQQLLRQMRSTYGEQTILPAVHPRYRASYRELYEEDEIENSTLGIRVVLCILLFVAFTVLEQHQDTIQSIDSDRIANEIHREVDLADINIGDLYERIWM